MPDEPKPTLPPRPTPPPPPPDAGHIPITEELDKAKWTLPPAQVIVIGVVAVAIVVALQFNLTNTTEKPVFIHHLEATANAGGKQSTDDHALSAIDYPRYIKAYPDLAQHSSNPIMPETKINPGQRIAGAAIFYFDVPKDAFESRQPLVLRVVPYDRPAFELKEDRPGTNAK